MHIHPFILAPGAWIGEGKVTFSMSPEIVRFYTKWVTEAVHDGKIACEQRVEKGGGGEDVFNTFTFYNLTPERFTVELSNEELGTVTGSGVIDEKTIAWEFKGNPEFQGFEVYELQENGDYLVHAEYSSTEDYRTIIDGRIWQKAAK